MSAQALRPRLVSKARLRFDRHAGNYLLEYPEKGLQLKGSAAEVIALCTGEHERTAIVAQLIARHPNVPADGVERDALTLLDELERRGLIEDAQLDGRVRPLPSVANVRLDSSANSGDAFRPFTLVAELTYRCPLRCAYCSNPVALHDQGAELDTARWRQVIEQAEALGVVQLHLTGGEPLLRPDLEALVEHATALGLYSNLITSAVPLTRERLARLQALGLCNVQISVQGVNERDSERIAGRAWLADKLAAARWTRELGLPLTLNVVLHRENIAQVPQLVALAEQLGAGRLELANTQYLGWALENRGALLPSAEQIELARAQANEARQRLLGTMEILFVLPDYYTDRPRACMDGWARRYIVVSPDGLVLPCQQARSIRGLQFERAGDQPLERIWRDSPALNAFRGQGFMQEPCSSCERRTLDHGGCRCQAFALTGDAAATDPVCSLSPLHELVTKTRGAVAEPNALVALRLRTPPGSAT